MALITLIALIAIIASLVYFWIRKKFSFFEENGFLSEKPIFPYGNLKGVGKDFHISYKIKQLYERFRKRAPAFGMYFSISRAVVVTDLELVKNVLVRDFDVFHNRGVYFNEIDDPLTAHLFAIEDDAWRNMRSKLTPTFTSGKMKMMFSTLLEVADVMVDQLAKESSSDMIEMKEALAKFTTDVIGNIAFGLDLNSIKDPDSKFREMGRNIFKSNDNLQLKVLLLAAFKKFSRKMGMTVLPKESSSFFLGSIRDTVDYRLKNNVKRNDMMDMLIRLKEDGKISFNELAAQCFIFFFAGFETSSSTSCFVLYALALHQDIQEELRNEIKTILAKNNGAITYEGMQEMKYLQMVIDETLRMYGPVTFLVRKASKDYKIPDSSLTIQEGTLTLIPIKAIHYDPQIYPEPSKFDPERFSEENKNDRHQMAFIPFGDGPRNCIGLRFGLMQTKVALIKLLRDFKFSPSTKTAFPMKFDSKSIVLSPENGMWLKVEKLKSQ